MAEHGEACEAAEATSYCMNGGTCYRIPSMSTLACVCNSGFKGSRCEELQLLSRSQTNENGGLIAAVVIVVFLILVLLIIIIYYAY
ncbi:pro-neuregulin-4, membrane-bound-like, partial [Scleropages formosus]